MILIREPNAAGIFYNLDKESLLKELNFYFSDKRTLRKNKIFGVIVPHDKYFFVGKIIAPAINFLEGSNFLIIAPNHKEIGSYFSLMKEGLWKTPLGEIVVERNISEKILENDLVEYNFLAHKEEYSIELILPFLQFKLGSEFKILALLVKNFYDQKFLSVSKKVSDWISSFLNKEWKIIITTNLNSGKLEDLIYDKKLIREIEKFNFRKFLQIVLENDLKVCGFSSLILGLQIAKKLGARKCKLIKYSNSFEVLPETFNVTGYASFKVK